jgi:hypothetical protein
MTAKLSSTFGLWLVTVPVLLADPPALTYLTPRLKAVWIVWSTPSLALRLRRIRGPRQLRAENERLALGSRSGLAEFSLT